MNPNGNPIMFGYNWISVRSYYSFQPLIRKPDVVLPVEIRHVVHTGADVVGDAVTDRSVDGRKGGCLQTFHAVEFVNISGV
jgi:hypothetical protein